MNRVLAVAHSSRRRLAELITLATLTLAFAPAAYASGSSMPWETPLNSKPQTVHSAMSGYSGVGSSRGSNRRVR